MRFLKNSTYIILSIFLFSCSLIDQFNDNKAKQGKLTILVEDSSSRAILPGLESYDISYYKVDADGPRGIKFTDTFSLDKAYTNNFEIGDWSFKISAYNANDKIIAASRINSVTITTSSATSISVIIYPEGLGSLRLDFSWNDSSADTIKILGSERINNTTFTEIVNLSGKTNPFQFSKNSIAAGVYDISMTLESNGNVINTVKDILYIMDGIESSESINFMKTPIESDYSKDGTTFLTNLVIDDISEKQVKITMIKVENGKLDLYEESFSSLTPLNKYIEAADFTALYDVVDGHNRITYTLTNKPKSVETLVFTLFSGNIGGVDFINSMGSPSGNFMYHNGTIKDSDYFLVENPYSFIDLNYDTLKNYYIYHNMYFLVLEDFRDEGEVLLGENEKPYIPGEVESTVDWMIYDVIESSPRSYNIDSLNYPDFNLKYNFFSKYRGIAEYSINSKDGSKNFTGVAPFTFYPENDMQLVSSPSWYYYTPNYYLSPVIYRDDLLRMSFQLIDSEDANVKYNMTFINGGNGEDVNSGYKIQVKGYEANDPVVNYFNEVDILGSDDSHYILKGKMANETLPLDYLDITRVDVGTLNTSQYYENVYIKLPKTLDGSETIKFYNGSNVISGAPNLSFNIEDFNKVLNDNFPVTLGANKYINATSVRSTGATITNFSFIPSDLGSYHYNKSTTADNTIYNHLGYLDDVYLTKTDSYLGFNLSVNNHGDPSYTVPAYEGDYRFLYYGTSGKGVFSYKEDTTTGIFKALSTLESTSSYDSLASEINISCNMQAMSVVIGTDGTISYVGEMGSGSGKYNLFEENYNGIGKILINIDLTGNVPEFDNSQWMYFDGTAVYLFNNIVDFLKGSYLPSAYDSDAAKI